MQLLIDKKKVDNKFNINELNNTIVTIKLFESTIEQEIYTITYDELLIERYKKIFKISTVGDILHKNVRESIQQVIEFIEYANDNAQHISAFMEQTLTNELTKAIDKDILDELFKKMNIKDE